MPGAIPNGVHPDAFSRFQTSILAPVSTSNWTAEGASLYATPCIAVSPLLSTALTFPPSSRTTLMASTTSPSDQGSSPGKRVPTPAATSSGVVLSAFAKNGSAPRSARRCISSASAVLAAMRNGVASIMFRSVVPTFVRRVIRTFKVASTRDEPLHEIQASHRAGSFRSRIVPTGARLTHPADQMQGRPSLGTRVRIGFPVEKA